MEGDGGLWAFCLVIAAQVVAVVFVCEVRAENAACDDRGPGPGKRSRFAQARGKVKLALAALAP